MKSTKELARELGILRKRSRDDQSSHDVGKRARSSIQVFDYLIVIDFESTCWQDAKHRTQEIIEFPAVLLNTRSGEIENEFHQYVQPQESPILSEFCKQLTGITQDCVDNGIPLYLCLRRFAHWLAEISRRNNVVYNVASVRVHEKTCTFVTWSDWDLSVCLQYECRRKQLRKPVELNSWIDLRATYRQFYGRKPHGLNGALQEIGVTFEGREHSGLHDARNTARLAWHMIKDGCIMQITKSLAGTGSHSAVTTASVNMRPMIGVASIDGKSSSALASDGDEQSGWRNEHLGIRGVSSSAGMQRVKLSQTSDNPNSSNVYVQIEGASGETHLPAARSPVKPSTNVTRPSDSRERRVTETSREQLAVLSHEQLPDNAPGSVKQMTSGEKQLSPARTTKGILNTASSVYSGGDSIESKRDDHGVVDELFGLNVEEWLEDDIVDEGVASVAAANDAAEIDGRAASKSVTATTAAFIVHVDSALAQEKISLNSRRQLPSVETTLKDVTNTRSNHISSEMRKSVESYVINAQSPNHNRVTASSSGSHVTGPNIDENGQTGTTAATFKTPRQIIADVKTPLASNSRCFQTFNMTSSRQTPRNSGGVTPSLMKQTPPLCDCGCRAKRKFVQSPGPNMGRSFFCCGSSKVKSNCKFFKWEPASSPASAGNFTNVFTPSAYGSHSSSFGVTPISVRPRCVPVTRVLVPPPKP